MCVCLFLLDPFGTVLSHVSIPCERPPDHPMSFRSQPSEGLLQGLSGSATPMEMQRNMRNLPTSAQGIGIPNVPKHCGTQLDITHLQVIRVSQVKSLGPAPRHASPPRRCHASHLSTRRLTVSCHTPATSHARDAARPCISRATSARR